MILVSENLLAQISSNSYIKAVDYVNCKIIELSLNNSKDDLNDFQKDCPCNTNQIDYEKISQFLNKTKLDKNIKLSNEIESLKKLFNNKWEIGYVVKLLSEDIFENKSKYAQITAFGDKRKTDTAFVSFKRNLKIDLESKIFDLKQISKKQDSDTLIKKSEDIGVAVGKIPGIIPEPESTGIFNFINFKIDLLSIFNSIVLLLLCFFWLIHKKNNEVNRFTKEDKDFVKKIINESLLNPFNNANRGNWDNQNQDKSPTIRNLEDRIKNQETQLNKLAQLFVNKHEISPDNSNPISIEKKSEEPKGFEVKLSAETFYLSTPNSDGSFNASSSSPAFKEGASIYKFTKLSNNKALFQIDEREASIRLALQYPDKNIDPVCEVLNSFNLSVKRIITEEPGEAELEGDRWKKTKNTKIRYAN